MAHQRERFVHAGDLRRLAAGKVTEAAAALGQFSDQHQVLTTSTLVLWCLAMVWLVPLAAAEVLRPRLT